MKWALCALGQRAVLPSRRASDTRCQSGHCCSGVHRHVGYHPISSLRLAKRLFFVRGGSTKIVDSHQACVARAKPQGGALVTSVRTLASTSPACDGAPCGSNFSEWIQRLLEASAQLSTAPKGKEQLLLLRSCLDSWCISSTFSKGTAHVLFFAGSSFDHKAHEGTNGQILLFWPKVDFC